MDELKLALTLQAIQSHLENISIQVEPLEGLQRMVRDHEQSMRDHSGQIEGLTTVTKEHQSFVDKQTAGHSVGRWVAGLFFLVMSGLTAGSMAATFKFYYDQGALSAEVAELKSQLIDLQQQVREFHAKEQK